MRIEVECRIGEMVISKSVEVDESQITLIDSFVEKTLTVMTKDISADNQLIDEAIAKIDGVTATAKAAHQAVIDANHA